MERVVGESYIIPREGVICQAIHAKKKNIGNKDHADTILLLTIVDTNI